MDEKKRNLITYAAVALAAAALYLSYQKGQRADLPHAVPALAPAPAHDCDGVNCLCVNCPKRSVSPFSVQCPFCNRALRVTPPSNPYRRGDLPATGEAPQGKDS